VDGSVFRGGILGELAVNDTQPKMEVGGEKRFSAGGGWGSFNISIFCVEEHTSCERDERPSSTIGVRVTCGVQGVPKRQKLGKRHPRVEDIGQCQKDASLQRKGQKEDTRVKKGAEKRNAKKREICGLKMTGRVGAQNEAQPSRRQPGLWGKMCSMR